MMEGEDAVLSLSAQLWNNFLQLPDLKQDHLDDFRFHIHALQAIIALRQVKILLAENQKHSNAHNDLTWQLQKERDRL